MTPKQTAESYNQIASHWAGEKFNRKNGIAQHERAFRFIKNTDYAIDIGCGSSGRFIDMMLSKGFMVEGLDLSTEMLALAKERHPKIVFYHADICTWDFPKKYDFISAWDSVWHAPLDEHAGILEKLCNGLSSEGVLIYTSGALDEPNDVIDVTLGQTLYTAALGIPNILKIIEECDCVCRHLEYDDPHPGLHLYLIIQKKTTT